MPKKTKKEIKDKLDELGVEYKSNASLKELDKLLKKAEKNLEKEAEKEVEEPVEEPTENDTQELEAPVDEEVEEKVELAKPNWMDKLTWEELNYEQKQGICEGKSLEEVRK